MPVIAPAASRRRRPRARSASVTACHHSGSDDQNSGRPSRNERCGDEHRDRDGCPSAAVLGQDRVVVGRPAGSEPSEAVHGWVDVTGQRQRKPNSRSRRTSNGDQGGARWSAVRQRANR